jgi:serine O-acetyltransferase
MKTETLLTADLDAIAVRLRDNYYAYPRLHHIDSEFMPNREAVTAITHNLFALVFPGFFGRQDRSARNIDQQIRQELEGLHQQLAGQILQCFHCRRPDHANDLESRANAVAMKFLDALPALREILAQDILAAFKEDPAARNTDEIIFSYPSSIAIATYRLANLLWRLEVPLMPRIMTEHAHSITGIDIHPGATVGRGFFIDHGTGVVIGETAVIGENCTLYQGVTLGALNFPRDETGQILRNYKRHPTLEDDVVVYSNASILGNITIGKGATVGGGVFLTQSVPPGCIVSAKAAELKYRNRCPAIGRNAVHNYQI